MGRVKEDLMHGAFALACVLAVASGTRASASEQAVQFRQLSRGDWLYCTDPNDADALAEAMAKAGEGTHSIFSPPSCKAKRITYEPIRVWSLHTKDHILWVGVVEAADAFIPEKKYYLIVPTLSVPADYKES